MISKHKLRLKISDLEKQLKWKDAEMDIMKNDIHIYLSKIRNLEAVSKKWQNDYNKEYDKAREAEVKIEYLRTYIASLQSKDLDSNRKIKSLEEENKKLRKVACVGEILNIMQDSLGFIEKNIKLEDKIDRISAIVKED